MSTVLCLLCLLFYSLNHNLSGVTFFCLAVLSWTLLPFWTTAMEILLSSFPFQIHDSFSKEMFTSRSHQPDASQSAAFPLGESQAASVIWVRFFFHHRAVGHLCSGSNYLWKACCLANIGCGNQILLIGELRTSGQSHQGTFSEYNKLDCMCILKNLLHL